jgi:hypothetical protein
LEREKKRKEEREREKERKREREKGRNEYDFLEQKSVVVVVVVAAIGSILRECCFGIVWDWSDTDEGVRDAASGVGSVRFESRARS